MEFRIADTFTSSLARLTGDEQKAVKTTAFDLQINVARPSLRFHKLDKAKDTRFWSVRVSSDLRIIVHRSDTSLLLCYVDHHDKAFGWAERRKLETHPATGAAQLVEIRETVKEIVLPVYTTTPVMARPVPQREAPRLFAAIPDVELLGYGVPTEWLADAREATADSLFVLAEHLPAEAAEALLELATGGTPRVTPIVVPDADPFAHPDAQRRFRVMSNVEELERALDFPWDRWTVFLHPEQQQLVEREYNGPARVAGSAGTGKTIVALHRAAHVARENPNSRVLLTTFTDTLASALRIRLRRLLGNSPRLAEQIDVHSLEAVALRLYRLHIGPVAIVSRETMDALLAEARAAAPGAKFTAHFLRTEWEQVVDAWQLDSWDGYRDVARLGRKTRLPEAQRAALWTIFDQVRAALKAKGLMTTAAMFTTLAARLTTLGKPVYDQIVVDEAQDLSVAQLRFLAALGGERSNALFFAGDLGQRIFQQPFSWKALGVDVRGRSRTLRVNYRTSHQIRRQADRLLGPVVADVDGNSDSRADTVSVFNGPAPSVRSFASSDEEIAAVGAWLRARSDEGVEASEIGIFVRSEAEIDRARRAVKAAGLPFVVLDEKVDVPARHVSVSTMNLAKGLEFRAVVVMACDDEVIPLQERIESVGDDADLQEVYETERQLLYVACTRARDHLLVTSTAPASEYLDDMQG